jgi:hypothetical protein
LACCVGLFLNSIADAQGPSGVVRIGILNDQSGPYGDFGGKTSGDAARMAVEDVGGKVLGKSIEIIIGDHQNKPDVASAIARRWFDVDGISAVAELTNSAVALAVQQIARIMAFRHWKCVFTKLEYLILNHSLSADCDSLLAPRRSQSDPRLYRDARGRHYGIRKKLAAAVNALRCGSC